MSCAVLDKDQTFIVEDYGPSGFVGSTTMNLQHGLQPGAIISVVSNTNEYMEVNVKDLAGQVLIHVVNRIGKADFGINSYLNGKWGSEEKVNPLPVQKGVRTVTTLIYESTGYRLFINGKEIILYKHRATTTPHQLHVTNCQIYKIIYLTPRDIIP